MISSGALLEHKTSRERRVALSSQGVDNSVYCALVRDNLEVRDIPVEFLLNDSVQPVNLLVSTSFETVSLDHYSVVGHANPASLQQALRRAALLLAEWHFESTQESKSAFVPGEPISYAGRVYGAEEVCAAVDASLEFWLTSGRYSDEFENKISRYIGVRKAHIVNSGSSANLVAVSALTSPLLGDRRLRAGDEVITVAAGFPTTVAPIIQNRLVPVFVDITIPHYNIDTDQMEAALSPRTRAVMIAHTLGNPFDVARVVAFCKKHDLFLIEDNCDALGSEVIIDGKSKLTGSFGHIATSSFYPPHHITMGEGGAVYTNDPKISRAAVSFRDWGRDCWCPSGKDNTCGLRFEWELGKLPKGYDHKYIYSHFGYNLKATDIQAAIGCRQLDRLPDFVAARRKNYVRLFEIFKPYSDEFVLPEPTPNTNPSWFGFMLTIRPGARFNRAALVHHLESHAIQTRMLFSGNLTRQPCMDTLSDMGASYRVVGDLKISDVIMSDSFLLGVYPGITDSMMDYIEKTLKAFFATAWTKH